MSDAPAWFTDETEPTPGRPRRRLLTAVVVIAGVWGLLALALVRSAPDVDVAARAPHTAAAAHAPAAEDAAPERASSPVPGTGYPDTTEDAPGDGGADRTTAATGDHEVATTVGRGEAEALALAVVRAWLSDEGPDLGIPGLGTSQHGYLEHATVERVDVPSRDLAVARVLTVLLLRDGDRYAEAVIRHVAVPLALSGSDVRPAGPPWWLPSAPDLATAPPTTFRVDDPDALDEVSAALDDAGYRVAVITEVRASEGGALVALVTATTPHGEQVDGPVWFGPSADGLTVLGWPGPTASGEPAPPPADAPVAPDD